MTGPEVRIQLPGVLEDPETGAELIRRACIQAIDAELPTVLGEIVQSGKVPTNRGILRAAVSGGAVPARVVDGAVVGEILVGGDASQYAAVQDMGRRAGKPMSWRVLYFGPGASGPDGWRTGWVNRRMRSAVEALASKLASEDARHVEKTKRAQARSERKLTTLDIESEEYARTLRTIHGRIGKTPAKYQARACYLIARSIAAKIRAEGMAGKRFIADELPKIRERVAALATSNIAAELRRAGLGE